MKSTFGLGIYTISDASEILRIPKRKVRYWFNKYVSGEFSNRYKGKYFLDAGDIIAVNFYTLVETYTFYHLKEKGLPTKTIIEAHNILGQMYNTPYPFALHKFLASGAELFHEISEEVTIALNNRNQIAIKGIIQHYAENFDFSKGLAHKYYPAGRKSSVVINPENQFGAPIIDGTNIKISALMNLYRGGEDVKFIAELYELKTKQVKDAIKFAA